MTAIAERYGWGNAGLTYSADYLLPAVTRLLRTHGVRTLIDVGTGNGGNLPALSSEGRTVVAVEPDKDGARIAQESNPGIQVYNLGVYDDPTPIVEGPFDAAVSLEVIEHLFDPAALPRFAAPLLKPGGKLIVSTPYHGYLKNLGLALAGKWDFHLHPTRVGGHIKFFSRRTLTELLQQNGYNVVQFTGAGRLPGLWKSMVIVATKLA